MGVVRGPQATKGSARSSSRIPGSGTTSSFQRFFSFSPGFDCLVANALCPKADSFSPPRCFDTNYMKRDTRRGSGISLRVEEEEEEERERTEGRLMLSSALRRPPCTPVAPVSCLLATFLAEFRPRSCEKIFAQRASAKFLADGFNHFFFLLLMFVME